ncbi:hypothetical protein AB2523_25090 [Klebsiella michiganensis]|uniref:hypothetical protein n=1 Tax=Klebsiella michiganensis TaxID=1134687 RepID=UPI003464E031
MIGGILVNFIVVVCCFWVFFDAASNKIGMHKVKDGVNKGYRSGVSPIVWGAGSLFIIPFFIYLFRRKTLLSIAKENPVITDKSTGFIIMFLIVSIVMLYSFKEYVF